MIKLPIDIFHPNLPGLPFKMFFKDENGQRIIVHPKAKGEIHLEPLTGIKHVFYDEDGFLLKTADEIRNFNVRMGTLEKEAWLQEQKKITYKLSRWAKEVVKILKNNDGMQNADIMQELYNLGYNGGAQHISQFFKSKDGKRFKMNELENQDGYWSLRNN